MASDIHSVLVGETWRKAGMVARSSGGPITAGIVSYYLTAKNGANAGKWWDNATQTWVAVETGNAMSHEADGNWTIQLASSPFVTGAMYLEYAKESGDLHVAGEGRLLRGQAVVDEVEAVSLPDPAPAGYGGGDATAVGQEAILAALVAMAGDGWSDETLKAIKEAVDGISAGSGASLEQIFGKIVEVGTDGEDSITFGQAVALLLAHAWGEAEAGDDGIWTTKGANSSATRGRHETTDGLSRVSVVLSPPN